MSDELKAFTMSKTEALDLVVEYVNDKGLFAVHRVWHDLIEPTFMENYPPLSHPDRDALFDVQNQFHGSFRIVKARLKSWVRSDSRFVVHGKGTGTTPNVYKLATTTDGGEQ